MIHHYFSRVFIVFVLNLRYPYVLMSFNARFHLPSPLENDGHPLARLLRGQDDRR